MSAALAMRLIWKFGQFSSTSLWRAYRTVDGAVGNFQMTRISRPADIYPVFRKLFARHQPRSARG